jgi:hypothetical protein
MNLLQFTSNYAARIHRGERFKHVAGVYYDHVKAVAERMHTVEEKALALMHDTLETQVRRALGKTPDRETEEAFIQQALEQMRADFGAHGFDIDWLLPQLNVLTKRRSEPDYDVYIDGIIAYAQATGDYRPLKVKKGDLKDNMDPGRNPPYALQTPSDHERLARYDHAWARITTEFPKDQFPQLVLHVTDRERYREGRDLKGYRKEEKEKGHARRPDQSRRPRRGKNWYFD